METVFFKKGFELEQFPIIETKKHIQVIVPEFYMPFYGFGWKITFKFKERHLIEWTLDKTYYRTGDTRV